MTADVAPTGPAPAPGLGRALALWGLSAALMLLIGGGFYYFQSRARALTPEQLSAAISLGAVLLPTVIACYWPRTGAPGRLPAYDRPSRDVWLGTLFVSLPLYALSAAALVGLTGWATGRPDAPGLVPAGGPGPLAIAGIWLAFALLPAIAEEMMYRGVLQPAIAQRWGPAWGIGVTAALFAFVHMEPAGLLPRMLMGLWFGYLAFRTGSLWASTWAHMLNNTWGVLLLASQAWVPGHPLAIVAIAAASLAAGAWCFHRAGWLGAAPASEAPRP